MDNKLLETRNPNGELPTTRWSIVQAVAGEGTQRRDALETFARDYWPAISLHNTERPSSDLRIGGIALVEVEDAD